MPGLNEPSTTTMLEAEAARSSVPEARLAGVPREDGGARDEERDEEMVRVVPSVWVRERAGMSRSDGGEMDREQEGW